MLLSVKIFLFMGAVALLQMIPITGVILMFAMVPFWSVLLVNLGFVVLAFEAATGRAPLWAGALPLLWFGGYALAAWFSHMQADRFIAGMERANAGVSLPFDPATQDLLIRPGRDDSTRGLSLTARQMVVYYGLQRAFEKGPWDNGDPMRSTWIEQGDCPDRMGAGVQDGRVWNRLHVGGYGTGEKMRSVPGICLWSGEGAPTRGFVTVESGRVETAGGLITTQRQEIILRAPDGQEVRLQSGQATPLSWWPMPIIGGALNSGAAKWQTFAGFHRESIYKRPHLALRSDRAVGTALGLRFQEPKDRFAARFAP